MRDRRLATVALALFAMTGTWRAAPREPLAETGAALRTPVVALPHVAAPGTSPAVDEVLAHLERYARRTGLTRREREQLAKCIVVEAERHRLEPTLVLAVMHIESLYDTYAVSDKDAMGLMQILPTTAEWLAARTGIEWRGPQSLFDPLLNVKIGVTYLRQLVDRYDGDIATALAAYNWGPGHIDRRLRRGAPLPTVYARSVLAAYGASPTRS
jgi:soluble lytic murein transglycosylase-like protein